MEYFYDHRNCFTYVRPLEPIRFTYKVIVYIINLVLKPLKAAGRGTLDLIRVIIEYTTFALGVTFRTVFKVVTAIGNGLYIGLKAVLNGIATLGIYVVKLIVVPLRGANSFYFNIFRSILKFCRSLGIIGEILFTFIGLVYLLWPLGVAYILGKVEYYIPAGILAIILIVQGRKVIVSN